MQDGLEVGARERQVEYCHGRSGGRQHGQGHICDQMELGSNLSCATLVCMMWDGPLSLTEP